MGGHEVRGIEIIGFDNHGNVGTSQAELRDDRWTITGAAERFAGRFSAGDTVLSGRWELSSDGSTWLPWMEITLTRDA